MKIVNAIVIAAVAMLVSVMASAQEAIPISIQPPPNLIADSCKTPVWKGLNVVWGGVIDKRKSPEVGVQTQKGKEPIPVVSSTPLNQLFDKSIKELLTACGMKLTDKGGEDVLNLSAEIRDFYVGVEKKLVTGKSEAKSALAFMGHKGNTATAVVIGYEIDAKKIRSGNIKQLEATLGDLFSQTLKQVTVAQEMRDLK